MKIQFLGTCAAEGIPALWCNCENCIITHSHSTHLCERDLLMIAPDFSHVPRRL